MDSGGNRNLENGRETRNQPGLGQRVHLAHRFRFGTGSQGINSRILLPLTTLVHFPLRVSRARWCILSLVAFRLEIAFRELVILLVSVIRLVRDGSKTERRARLPEERNAINTLVIPVNEGERGMLKSDLEDLGCAGLLERPWNLKNKDFI